MLKGPVGPLEGWILEWIVQQSWSWIVEPISENILDALLGELGTIELGGPFAFETDMMGVDFGVALADVYGDPDGLAIGMALSLGDLSSDGARDMPIPTEEDAPSAQLALGIHEALFHQLLSEQLLGMLSQELDLGGAFGNIIGNGILMLPGGDDAPEGDGWCLSINPGTATVVRMQQNIEPLALLYVPDMKVQVGIKDGDDCDDWLVASLAAEIALNIKDGSKIGIDFDIAEGALLYYGADDYEEQEVVSAFGMYLEGLLGLVGGFAEFDLAEILGGGGTGLEGLPLDALSINIKDSSQISVDGALMPGLFALSIDLWNPEQQDQVE